MKSPSSLFYRWWIVIAAALAHAVSTGLSYFGLSAYFPSLEREFGWSRTAISGAFSLARIESGLLGPAEGYLTDRFGPRLVMLLGISTCALGFFLLSLVDSLPMLYAVMVFGIVLGSSLGFFVPLSVVVAKLFRTRRSLAFGIFRMGPGLSGALVPLVGWCIGLWGWRVAAVVSALIVLAVGIPLALLIGRYEEYQEELPPTSTARSSSESPAAGKPHAAICRSLDVDFTLKEALRTLSFWMLSLAMGLRQMVTEGVSVHFVILLVDRGWTMEIASTLLGISALVSAPARLAMGWLGDYFDKRHLMILLLIALTISVFFMGWSLNEFVFMPFMVIYSLAYGGLASLQEATRADYFGTRHFATIQGFSRMVITGGTFLGPLLAGFFYDLTRSYAVPFTIFAVVSLMATFCMVWAKPPRLPERIQTES